MSIFLGKNRSSSSPSKRITQSEETYSDIHGRTYTIPAGVELKQFETLNKGWNVWRDPDGNLRIRDCG